MTYSFHPLARQELDTAIDYYEEQEAGLGIEFAEEVYSSIQRLVEYPTAWTQISQNARRCLTNRFPYGIIYQKREDGILIVAVSHLHRKPGYWKDRQ